LDPPTIKDAEAGLAVDAGFQPVSHEETGANHHAKAQVEQQGLGFGGM
jgi:hypothetical protein